MKNKLILLVLNIVFGVILLLFMLTTNISILINSKIVYISAISRYNISETTQIHPSDLIKVYSHWINFFNFKESTPQIVVRNENSIEFELLSEKEIIHLEDVRKLIKINYISLVASIILLALIIIVLNSVYKDWKILYQFLLRTSSVLLMIMVICVIFTLVDFDRLFISFHQISFSNNYWILDPARDYLIMLFPREFFVDVTMLLLLFIFVELAIIAAISYLVLIKFEKGNKLYTTGAATT